MKPIPARLPAGAKTADEKLAKPSGTFSKSNRRTALDPSQLAYPWLLSISTALAAIFCLLYITKPVIQTATLPSPPSVAGPAASPTKPPVLLEKTNPTEKPSSSPSSTTPPVATTDSPFEETNLRIQHILTAETPVDPLAHINLDIPALYQSHTLRWSAEEIAEARTLLTRLKDYQKKTQSLRDEGAQLLGAWNHLIHRSIPIRELRADSPTLPADEQRETDEPIPAKSQPTTPPSSPTIGK